MRWLKGRWDRMSLIWEFLFLAVILGAAVSDWKTRRISNRYPEKGLYALFFGLVFGGFFGLGLTVLKKRKKEEAIPLGPFLAAGIAAESLSFFFY